MLATPNGCCRSSPLKKIPVLHSMSRIIQMRTARSAKPLLA